MITEWFLGLLSGLVEGLATAMPVFSPPSWVAAAAAPLGDVLAFGSSMGAWVPLTFTGQVAGLVLLCSAVALATKIARIVVSFLTLGGGSAG